MRRISAKRSRSGKEVIVGRRQGEECKKMEGRVVRGEIDKENKKMEEGR